MKVEATLWSGVVGFFVLIAIAYLAVGGEPAGITLLLGAAAFGGLVAGWTWDWTRQHDARIEDRADADASDRAGIVGVYPTASLRPLALAVGVTATALGVALGSWLSMIGLAITASQVLLLVRDTDT